MSGLFMDVQCSRPNRWYSHQNTPPTSASETTATSTSTSESSSSPCSHLNDHIANNHHNDSCTADCADAARNANYNFNKQKEAVDDKCDDNEEDDAFDNILSLKLRKPKHWKWELSTSKSCSNIALPRILLYNHKGKLLVDAYGDREAVYTQDDHEPKPKGDKTKKRSHESHKQQPEYRQRSATTNLTHSIRKALENDLNGLHIQEATPSPERISIKPLSQNHSRKAIDFDTANLPDQGLSRRSSSLRGVRFNVENNADYTFNESHIPEFLPTPPSTTTPTSSSSGPREKRKYRRSQSSGRSSAHSGSILERFSFQKGRFSSPENVEETQVQHSPCYFLRSCNAGTLVVKEDSFIRHPKRRRRLLRHRSTESLLSAQKFPLSSSSSTQTASASKRSTTFLHESKRKQQPLRRHLTEGNFLSKKPLSTSEEDDAEAVDQKPMVDNGSARHLYKYPQTGNEATDINRSTDVHQIGKVR